MEVSELVSKAIRICAYRKRSDCVLCNRRRQKLRFEQEILEKKMIFCSKKKLFRKASVLKIKFERKIEQFNQNINSFQYFERLKILKLLRILKLLKIKKQFLRKVFTWTELLLRLKFSFQSNSPLLPSLILSQD